MLSLVNLKCDNQKNPRALSTRCPAFQWQLESDRSNVVQKNYRVCVWEMDRDMCWDSKLRLAADSTTVVYDGSSLKPNTRYHWQVEVTDNYGETAVSDVETFITSYYDTLWQAKWITSGEKNPKDCNRPVEVFQKQIVITKKVTQAVIRISAMGLYQLFMNNSAISEDCFTPGYTSYSEYLQYQTYDAAARLQQGRNELKIYLSNGWFCGRIMNKSNVYGECTALIAELEVIYEDGTRDLWCTDQSFRWSKEGPIRSADFYDGETYDATKEMIPESSYREATILGTNPLPKLVPHFGTVVKRQQELIPIGFFQKQEKEYLYDMGQNFAGWVRIRVKEAKGTKILISHSEILDENKNLMEGSHNGAKSLLTYICKGGEEEIYEPSFTFMGFRYVKIQGISDAELATVTGIAAYSDMEQTGSFHCSNEKLNKLWSNILWSQKSNFLEIPTDCPQRSERLGWLGDIAIFARTACFNMDLSLFIRKWMTDLRVEFDKFGKISMITPDIGMMGSFKPPVAGWGDAAVMVPWMSYLAYGDKKILEDNYQSMKKWVETERCCAEKHSAGHKKYIWNTGFQFGDWLAPQGNMLTWMRKKKWLSTAYYAYSTGLLAKAAQVLGKEKDVKMYTELAESIKQAFCAEFVNSEGTIKKEFQSAYACALYFDLLPEHQKKKAAERLADLIKANDGCLATGFLGTPFLMFALSDHAQLDAAYQLLLNEKCPSWLYPITKGATTMWECWDLILEDGTLKGSKQGKNPKFIRSFNHYAYGSVGDWLHRRAAGLEPLEPGYSHFLVKPMPGGGLTDCSIAYLSRYGAIKVHWEIKAQRFNLKVTVPANTKATIELPDRTKVTTGSGNWEYSCDLIKK